MTPIPNPLTPCLVHCRFLQNTAQSATNDAAAYTAYSRTRVICPTGKSASKNRVHLCNLWLFLCKTNPIHRGQNCSIPLCTKELRKIYIFVESQKQTQFKPKFTRRNFSEGRQAQFYLSRCLISGSLCRLGNLGSFYHSEDGFTCLEGRKLNQ
jgi:hypothetical protein